MNNVLQFKDIKIFNYTYYVFLAFLFFSGISISISQGLLLLTSILFAIGLFKNRNNIKWQKSGLEKYILPFIVISLILAFLSPLIIKNLNYIRDFWLISAFILAYSLHNSKRDIKKTLYMIVLIVFLQSLIALIQINFNIHFIQKQNIIGIFHNIDPVGSLKIYGGLLGMHLVFSCYLVMLAIPVAFVSAKIIGEFKNKLKFLIILPVILSVIALLITKTNSILFALPFSIIPLFFIKKKRSLTIILISAVLILIAGIFSFISPIIESRKMFINNICNSAHVMPRINIWKTAFHVWLKHPILGAGGGYYLDEFAQVLKEHPEYDTSTFIHTPMITHAHNDYLNQLARKGIIGFLAFVYMLFGIFKYLVANLKYIKDKLLKSLYLGLFGAYCVFLVASLFQCFFTTDTNLVMLWFTIGLAAAIVKIEKGSVENNNTTTELPI
jgi:putative inorganic carbon (hco3(-)) transporter